MTELNSFLQSLISTAGLSGHEGPARELISAAWQPLVDEISISRLGSLHALRRGVGAEPRPRLLLMAHMDAIGLMVASIVDGFLRLAPVGGLDARILPGQPVTVHGREELPGRVVMLPPRLRQPGQESAPPELGDLLVDVGLEAGRVAELVRVGDLVSFAQPPFELSGGALAGHSLDNRASVAALTVCLQELCGRRSAWDVVAVAAVQEELTFAGAYTSTYTLRPDLAVAVDVTYARGPGASDYNTFPLDGGPTLGWGPNVHPGLYRRTAALADRLEIPWRMEPMPRHSGTDAYAMQVSADGVPTMVVSIPLRYMHTPVEMVVLQDIRRTGRLLAELAAGLEPDYLESLTWDEEP